jgi:glucose/arabinose dehydrogenase
MATEVTPNPIPELILKSNISIEFEDFVTAPATAPTGPRALINFLYHADDGSGRLFVNDSRGPIWVINDGVLDPEPFLDMREARAGAFDPSNTQKGLRSFAFHPDYETPGAAGFGKVYTIGTEKVGAGAPVLNKGIPAASVAFHDVVTEWEVDADDPSRIDVSTRREVVRIANWGPDHNSDQLMFNPNAAPGSADYGKLYITTGDGGNNPTLFDPYDQAQDPGAALGKVLRIDPLEQAGGAPYGIPADNPFRATAGALPEVWALGFRHPQNQSFDTGGAGRHIITDMGQKQIEEVNLALAGANYGWPLREGTFEGVLTDQSKLFTLPDDDASFGFTYPVAQYDHDDPSFTNTSKAVVGGFVYRGDAIPALVGHYIFGDLVNGTIYHVPVDQLRLGQQAEFRQLNLLVDGQPTTLLDLVGAARADLRFGQGPDGEIYVLTKQDGEIRLMAPVAGVATPGDDVITGTPGPDVIDALAGNDTVFAAAGADTVSGNDGNDTLNGNEGPDLVQGQAGTDSLNGGPGADRMLGGGGGDVLRGEAGVDQLTGGSGGGRDRFDYDAVADSRPGATLRDLILGFDGIGAASDIDRIDLAGIDANAATAGNGTFTFRGTAAFTAPGQVRVAASGTDTLVQANTTGTGTAEPEIAVRDGAVLPGQWSAGDFLL